MTKVLRTIVALSIIMTTSTAYACPPCLIAIGWVAETIGAAYEGTMAYVVAHPIAMAVGSTIGGEVVSKLDPTGIVDVVTSVDPKRLAEKGFVKGVKSFVKSGAKSKAKRTPVTPTQKEAARLARHEAHYQRSGVGQVENFKVGKKTIKIRRNAGWKATPENLDRMRRGKPPLADKSWYERTSGESLDGLSKEQLKSKLRIHLHHDDRKPVWTDKTGSGTMVELPGGLHNQRPINNILHDSASGKGKQESIKHKLKASKYWEETYKSMTK